MFDEAKPICVVGLDLDLPAWNHLLFCQNYCQSPPPQSVNRSHREHQNYQQQFQAFLTRVTAENEIAKIFGRKYFQLCSALSLRHCSEDRWYHLAEIWLSDEELTEISSQLDMLAGREGGGSTNRRCARSSIKVACCLLWSWGGGVCYRGTWSDN